MNSYRPGTFDSRIVQYEKVHQITDEQITALIEAVDLKPGQKILDGCAGYGSVTKWILKAATADSCEFYVQDDSLVQIDRAKSNLKEYSGVYYSVGDIKALPFETAFFDTVVIKMGLHENPKDVQYSIVKEAYRILKPGGRLVVWELYLTPETQSIFQAFMRKKDQLSGFDALVHKRYFPQGVEVKDYFLQAGFIGFKEEFLFNPVLNTRVRLNELVSREMKEKGLSEPDKALSTIAVKRLDELNNFFRNNLTIEEKQRINFKDEGDNIAIYNINKAIVSASKPL